MDGPEGDVDMEQAGNDTTTRSDQQKTGADSPTSHVQHPTSVEQSSPISSDVEPSSQSASSSNASGQLGRENLGPLQAGPSEEGKHPSPHTSRAGSLYSSPHTQASTNGSIHPSLKSNSSRKGGLAFPIVMSSGPASPRTDTTSAAAEDMVGIVSASEVQTYVGELADENAQGKTRRASLAHDTQQEQGDRPGIERGDTLRQNGRGRRASSPGRTFRHSIAIPITNQRNGGPSALSRSLTEQTMLPRRSLPPTVSQPQRFKRFVGSLFRSKSVSSAADEDETPVERAGSPLSSRRPALEDSPRRTQSMAPSAHPLQALNSLPQDADSAQALATSPSAMSIRSATHPGSVTPRIRTRSERSTSPRGAHHREAEINLDSSPAGGEAGHSPKRSKSRREGAGKQVTAGSVEWTCRPAQGMDGVVSGIEMG